MSEGRIEVSWLDSLTELPATAWNRLAAEGGFYLSHAWLSIQEHDPDSVRRYAVARRRGELVGAVCVDLVEQESNDFYQLSAVLPDGCPEPDGPLLLVGGHGGYHSGFVLAPSLDAQGRVETVRALIGEVLAAGREHGRRAVCFYLQHRFLELVTASSLGGTPLLARHEAALHLPGDEWPDYLATLPASRRTNIRGEEKRFEQAGYETGVGDLTPWLDEAGALLANVQRRYGHHADPADMAEHLTELICDLGEHVAFRCHDDQGLVGFALGFRFGRNLAIRAAGFGYERLRHAAEYFNLVYYLPIRWAYQHDVRTVHLGIGSLRAKALRGATLRPLWVVPLGWSWPDPDGIEAANRDRAAAPTQP